AGSDWARASPGEVVRQLPALRQHARRLDPDRAPRARPAGARQAGCARLPRRLRCRLHLGRGAHAVVSMAIAPELPRAFLRDMRREDLLAVLDIERRSFAQPWSRAFSAKELATPFARLGVAGEGAVPRPRVIG